MDEAKRIYCDLVEELPDDLEELGAVADTDEDECSRCGSIKVRYRLETTDVHIAARYGFQWMTEPDEDGEYPEYVEWDDSTPLDTVEAEYEDADLLDDAAWATYAADVKAAVTAEREEAARQREIEHAQRVEDTKAEFARLVAEVPTMNVHPFIKAQATLLLGTVDGCARNYKHAPDPVYAAMSSIITQVRVLVAGVVSGFANGKHYVIHTGNIGGQRVDHLREGGLIGVVEGHVQWTPGISHEAYKRARKASREFYRPSEVYDILQRAAVTA